MVQSPSEKGLFQFIEKTFYKGAPISTGEKSLERGVRVPLLFWCVPRLFFKNSLLPPILSLWWIYRYAGKTENGNKDNIYLF